MIHKIKFLNKDLYDIIEVYDNRYIHIHYGTIKEMINIRYIDPFFLCSNSPE